MLTTREQAVARVRVLKAEEIEARSAADGLPPGAEQDASWMRGERLADEVWSIEEAFDLDFTPSGLWH